MNNVLGIINALFALGILYWLFVAFSSIFFFDAAGSSNNWITIVLAKSIVIDPIPAGLGTLLFWEPRETSKFSEQLIYTAIVHLVI